jgi:hypothetical protein
MENMVSISRNYYFDVLLSVRSSDENHSFLKCALRQLRRL